jgi:AMP phosphorylase
MRLVARPINLEAGGKYIVILNKEDADFLGLHALDRVSLRCKEKELTAIVDITTRFTMKGEMITNDDVTRFFDIKGGEHVEVSKEKEPASIVYIKQKISGCRLEYDKIKTIVSDVTERKLSDIELTALVTALYTRGISIDEATGFSKAMVSAGKRFRFNNHVLCDKHSIGGIPGDKTSIVLVPILAAAGLTVPKTSSRAITSPAGTADRMEVLAPVCLSLDEIEEVVKKTGACLVWGGALDLSPADDEFIKIEYPLGIDPMLLPSIMSKKKAIGAKYVVIDIPTGREAKITNVQKARELAEDFLELGKRLGMHIACGVTFGDQPLGYCIGPALEAREALITLQGKGPRDLVEKSTMLSDILFNEVGLKDHGAALELLRSGKAEKKMREIIEAQGGDAEIKPESIEIGDKTFKIKSDTEGRVLWVKNSAIVLVAREAGAPKDKGAGIHMNVKMGDSVRKGDVLFTIHSNNYIRLSDAVRLAEELKPLVIGKKFEEKMLLERIFTEIPTRKVFMLER